MHKLSLNKFKIATFPLKGGGFVIGMALFPLKLRLVGLDGREGRGKGRQVPRFFLEE